VNRPASVIGTKRLLKVGQGMSVLPRYFRQQLVPLLPVHRLLQCQISDRVGMSEQKLDGAEVSRPAIEGSAGDLSTLGCGLSMGCVLLSRLPDGFNSAPRIPRCHL
jgi:hypothetical protein